MTRSRGIKITRDMLTDEAIRDMEDGAALRRLPTDKDWTVQRWRNGQLSADDDDRFGVLVAGYDWCEGTTIAAAVKRWRD